MCSDLLTRAFEGEVQCRYSLAPDHGSRGRNRWPSAFPYGRLVDHTPSEGTGPNGREIQTSRPNPRRQDRKRTPADLPANARRFSAAPAGKTFLPLGVLGFGAALYRTGLQRLVRRAGVADWPPPAE